MVVFLEGITRQDDVVTPVGRDVFLSLLSHFDQEAIGGQARGGIEEFAP